MYVTNETPVMYVTNETPVMYVTNETLDMYVTHMDKSGKGLIGDSRSIIIWDVDIS